MRILMICTNDPAGMGIAFTEAINRYTEHTCRLVTTTVKYNFHYKKDLHIPETENRKSKIEELEQVLRESDLFHFHTFADEETLLGPFRAGEFAAAKGVIFHQHGEPLRSEPERFRAQSGSKKFLVSTPDLLDLLPAAAWVPNLVPIENPLYTPLSTDSRLRARMANGTRSAREGNGGCAPSASRVRIGQSPTKKEIKDTDLLLRTYARLKAKHNGFLEMDLIENTSHADCLERKRRCHIFFDHLQGYYGVSSLEALSQGTPTIAGLSVSTREHVEAFTQTSDLPWVEAHDGPELERSLSELIEEPDRRSSLGRRSRLFMERHWHPRKVVERLMEEYQRL